MIILLIYQKPKQENKKMEDQLFLQVIFSIRCHFYQKFVDDVFTYLFLLLEIGPTYIFINKMQTDDIQCVFESMTGSGSIYISNFSAAQNLQLLQSKGIKAILSVARSGLINHKKEDIPHYLYIPAQDREDYPIHKYFDLAYDFIEKARRQCNVLIHCMVGVSRSVTIVIAYLLKKYKYSLGQVITMIQRKRRKLNPNKGFIEQLKKFSEKEGIKCDFQGLSIQSVRQNSTMKQARSYSAKKQNSPSKKLEHLSPISPQQRQIKKQRHFEDNAFYNQDLINPLLKVQNLELKKLKTFEEKSKENEQQELYKKDRSISKQKINLKKSFSANQGPQQRKRLSIEEKISKIRERIIKSNEPSKKQASILIYLNRRDSKNDLKKILDGQKSKKHKLQTSYRSIVKSNGESIQHKLKYEYKMNPNKLKQGQFNQFSPEDTNGQLFTSQFKLQSKPLYHVNPRINPRINQKIKQEANY